MELRFVLELDLSTLFSADASVETEWIDGARGRCSGVPKVKPAIVGLDGGSVSAFPGATISDETAASPLEWTTESGPGLAGPADVQRFRGGG